MATEVDLPEDAVVIRFSPTQPASVLKSVKKEYVRAEHHGASCFAAVPRDGETEEQVQTRLLIAAELSHVVLANNKNLYVCSRAADILALGVVFLKDDYDGELAEHYCADLGGDPTLDDVERFLGVFHAQRLAEVAP